jgi:predicted metal-dependent peptidase
MAAQAVMQWSQLPQQTPPKFEKPKGDERKRLKKARTALLLGQGTFFGLLALKLELVEAPWIVTAGVDGKHFFYNPAYIAPLADEELRGLWGHEVMHCANGHLWRRGSREHQKWNWAADYAIDPILKEAGLKVPNETVNPAWKGLSGEQVYPLLPEPPKRPTGGGGGQGQPQQGQGGQPGQGQQGQGDPRAPQYMPGKDVMLDPAGDEARQMQAEWKEATIQAAKAAKGQGKLPSNLEMLIDEWVQPRVDWKSVMRRFVQQTAKSDYRWRLPSQRHAARGYYLPRVESDEVPPMCIGWDTSGSHWDRKTQLAVGAEVLEILTEVRPQKIHVGYFDSILQGTAEWEPGDTFNPKPKGGGGTDFRPVFEWIEKEGIEPCCLVMVTDCMGTFPEQPPSYPVLWASTIQPEKLHETYRPPFGEVVYVDIDE